MGFSMFKNKMIIYLAVIFCLIMVTLPEITADASKAAISLWLNAVVPTLFPFIIMANFIQRTGIVRRMPMGIYPFVMALLSGYPMGARITADAYRSGYIDQQNLPRILSYSMITGPAFLIGAVGVNFFHSQMSGYILAVSHYSGALLNSLFYGGIFINNPSIPRGSCRLGDSYGEYLTDSILDGFKTIGIILAYIMMFMIGTDLLQFSGFFRLIEGDYTAALLKGMLEMTVGCNALSSCQCSMMTKLVLSSFLISFGAFSVMGQTMSMLKGCPIQLTQLIKMKLTHGIISGILAFTICAFVV